MKRKVFMYGSILALIGSTIIEMNQVIVEAIEANTETVVLESVQSKDNDGENANDSNTVSKIEVGETTSTSLEPNALSENEAEDQATLSDDLQSEQFEEVKQKIIDQQSVVEIPDGGLAELIRMNLGLAENEPITVNGMNNLTSLSSTNFDITIFSLEGLQYATNLVSLNMVAEKIGDLSPISNLTNLEEINFSLNYSFTDVSPLAGLPKLKKVYLDYNCITDISSIADLVNDPSADISIQGQVLSIEPIEVKAHVGDILRWEEPNKVVIPSNLIPNSQFVPTPINGVRNSYDSERNVITWTIYPGGEIESDTNITTAYSFQVPLANGAVFSGKVNRIVYITFDTSTTDTSTTDTSTTDTSTTDTSTTDTSTTDTSTTDTSTTDPSATDTSTTDTSKTNTGTGDSSTTDSKTINKQFIADKKNGSGSESTKKARHFPKTGEGYPSVSMVSIGLFLLLGTAVYYMLFNDKYIPKHQKK